MSNQSKTITGVVISRWIITIIVLILSTIVSPYFQGFIITIAWIASIFCELYWYLWQREIRLNKEN